MRRRVTVLVLCVCVCVCVCVSVCTPAPTTLVSTLKMGYVGVYLRLFLTSSQAFSLLKRLVSLTLGAHAQEGYGTCQVEIIMYMYI